MEDTQLESILKQIDVVRAKLAKPSEDARIEKLFKAIGEIIGAHVRVWYFGDDTWSAGCHLDGEHSMLVSSHCDHQSLESALTELLARLKERAEPKKEPEPDPVRAHFDAGGIVRDGLCLYRKRLGRIQYWSPMRDKWAISARVTDDGISASNSWSIPADSEIPELAKLGDCQLALLDEKWIHFNGDGADIMFRLACPTCKQLEHSGRSRQWTPSLAHNFDRITDDEYTIVEPEE